MFLFSPEFKRNVFLKSLLFNQKFSIPDFYQMTSKVGAAYRCPKDF